MITRYTHRNLEWLDLESPSNDEVLSIINEFNIEPLVAEELLLPTLKPRVEVYDSYMYVILHFPALRHTHQTFEQEIDFLIGKDFIITTRYDTIDPLHKFSKVFEVNSIVDKSNLGDHAGFVFYYMLKKLYKAVEHEIGYVKDSLANAEEQIFHGKEREMVETISVVGRELLNLRQAIEPHRDILKSIEFSAKNFFGNDFAPYLTRLTDEYYKVHNHIMRTTESLKELRETNNSLVNTKQNEVMKILTLMAFVTFPLSLIASIFGMNTQYLPIVGKEHDFWIIMGIMFGGMLLMFSFFKHKHWL